LLVELPREESRRCLEDLIGPTKLFDLTLEVKELRRANEILKAAATFFARELDPQPPR